MVKGVDIHYASQIEDVLAVALPLLKAGPGSVAAAPVRDASVAA